MTVVVETAQERMIRLGTRHESNQSTEGASHPWVQAVKRFLQKFLFEGQLLQDSAVVEKEQNPDSFFYRHRRLISFCLPPTVAYIIWLSYMSSQKLFHLFTEEEPPDDTPAWYMSVTMMFGSFIAGSTSEGGASVAFPVMTLVFGIAPAIARDFSFMIQSCGMTSASATILLMGVQIDYRALFYGTVGGVAGIILGLELVVPRLEPPFAKMYFVCIWASFAASLFWLNKLHGRRVFSEIPDWSSGQLAPSGPLSLVNYKAVLLVLFGFLGGIFSAIGGAGLDICMFSALTLLFRVSEKVATPTSVLLMGFNTLVGFSYTEWALGGVQPRAWTFFAVCVPIVVVCAPFGALCSSHWHRLVHANLVYFIDTAQLITALYVIRPWTHLKTDTPTKLTVSSALILVAGLVFFSLTALAGQMLLKQHGYPLLSDEALERKQLRDAAAGTGAGMGTAGGSVGGVAAPPATVDDKLEYGSYGGSVNRSGLSIAA